MIYLSGLLPQKHRRFYRHFKKLLDGIDVTYVLLENTKDIWCRDYMPVISRNKMCKFIYAPPYLQKHKKLITQAIDLNFDVIDVGLIVDGGNIVLSGDIVITTDAIFDWNRDYKQGEIIELLKASLCVCKVVVIPSYPGDIFRHADGVVKLLNENNAFVLDDRKYETGYTSRLITVLEEAGINTIPVPFVDFEIEHGDSFTAKGNYINILETKDYVVVPFYELPQDEEALIIYRKHYPMKKVVSIDCTELADEGGVLNCVTWN